MKRIIKALSWLAGIALYLGVLGFSANEAENQRASSLEINLEQPVDQLFISEKNITDIIDNQVDSIINTPLHLINTALLEESIENHPLIDEAEVYYTLDGRVSVDVIQHVAIARVRAHGEDVYMNKYGKPIPRSRNHSANVPMITGHIDSSQWREAYHFLQLLDDSPWLGDNLEAISRDSAGKYTVYPRMGRHSITWGELDAFEDKMKKLDVFYSYLTREGQMDSVRTIDVRFDKQVVSTKY
ncbi:cell division protein FtsQ/DivIB [Phaeocystidibacter marisrubri]|uniref:Cell division protein FtsQ/DivIB C-terminal domain-containing protein n=1 Tax=Phaeocystidibacter marisrubri TaxID=1577780 RepID=A0A6L3ZFM1_9FLAO|nr:cell division protein FtsQ/DivIB [Phaeocystidibacter marisrubri]KAB2816832.1 hypothetical protein F8C82_00085 [Phaeocystidibacter marisrubri]GGH77961.1 cell division protein FtsQ [Phaeocystidibacter marisrubri]